MKYFVKSRLSENISETPEGFLLCLNVPIGRTGEMKYAQGEISEIEPDDQGFITVERDEDEVFRPETMASFEGKPITIRHPEQFVAPENWQSLARGFIQNIRRGEGANKDDLVSDLLIADKMAIQLVKSGLREVSCGYECEYIQTGKGRGKQTKIIGNHLALVEEGRAGSSYAITDHKGAATMKFKEKIQAIFSKAQDEALKVADESAKDESAEPKSKEGEKIFDAEGMYDSIMKGMKDLGDKVAELMKQQKDAGSKEDPSSGKPAEVEAKDDDKEEEGKEKKEVDADPMEARLSALEAAVKKLLNQGSSEEAGDEDEEESEDNDFEEGTMVGDEDTVSRVEILAPGMSAQGKDVKVQALKQAYSTTEGKKIIDQFTGGKTPAYDSKEKVETLFVAASELLKVQRNQELLRTRTRDVAQTNLTGGITPEKLNEINAKFYGANKLN